jgi:ATP-binding cassette, subfamily F, member 3
MTFRSYSLVRMRILVLLHTGVKFRFTNPKPFHTLTRCPGWRWLTDHMILAQYVNVCFGYHDKLVVKNFSLQLKDRCRIGLIGTNGSGKTTLLKLLNRELQPDTGDVQISKGLRIGFLRQTQDPNDDETMEQMLQKPFRHLYALEKQIESIGLEMAERPDEDVYTRYDELQERYRQAGGYTFRARIEEVMQGIGVSENDKKRLMKTFSGGEQARIMLAGLLLERPDLLLLDEPTNHLDIQAVEFLENFLDVYDGGLMFISHDRYFLDRVASSIVELSKEKCTFFNGNYSTYKVKKAQEDVVVKKHYKIQQKRISRLEDFIRRNMAAQKTKQAQSRQKELDRIERIEDVTGSDKSMNLKLNVVRKSGLIVFEVENLTKSFDEKTLFKNVNLKLHRGERIGLIGSNGSGKSTLIKILSSQIPSDSGQINWGYNVTLAVYDQHLHDLNEESTILDEVWEERPEYTLEDMHNHLGGFLFSDEDVYKPINILSGGEKARVALAKLFLKDANLLLLDEPTNHLDLNARESLENALKRFSGSILLVTHDRYLLDRIVDKIWSLQNETFDEYPGNYSEYKEHLSSSEALQEKSGSNDLIQKKSRKAKRIERLQVRKQTGKSAIYYEREITRLETELAEVRDEMSQPEISHLWANLNDLFSKESRIQEEIAKTMELWEKAVEAENKIDD